MPNSKESVVQTKAFAFAIRIVNLYKWLIENKVPIKIADQLLKSGTSIGANLEEATGGYSRREFAAKVGISYKEARETRYWLRLLHATHYLNDQMANSMLHDCEELIRILAAIQISAQKPSG